MKPRTMAAVTVSLPLILMVSFSLAGRAGAAGRTTMRVVGLYSETAAGSVSYRTGTGDWIVVKVGDLIPDNAEILISVDRDWIELSPANNPKTAYELKGSEKGKVTKKVADILKQKPRMVSFPQGGGKVDPKFANKVVVKEYLGRQVYQLKADEAWEDIKYGLVLGKDAAIKIIAINNTLTLVLPDGKEEKIIGPLQFKVEQVLKGEKLYEYLNVH